ncbi:hypothetical protein D3C80_509850 [compost metagenome]
MGRVTAADEAPGEPHQEAGQPLFCCQVAQHQHAPVLTHDLAAHQAIKALLQLRKLTRQGLQATIGDGADFAVFQGNGVTDMVLCGNGIEAEYIARHPEVDHHALPLGGVQAGLETAATYGIEHGQRIVGIEQRGTLANTHAWAYQRAQAAVVVNRQTRGEAQTADPAIHAVVHQRFQVNRVCLGQCVG